MFDEIKTQGFLLIYFQLPCWLRKQRLRKINSKGFMSDQRKIESEIINYSINRGNETYANEMKKKQRILRTESCLAESQKVGKERELLSIPLLPQKAVAEENSRYKI